MEYLVLMREKIVFVGEHMGNVRHSGGHRECQVGRIEECRTFK